MADYLEIARRMIARQRAEQEANGTSGPLPWKSLCVHCGWWGPSSEWGAHLATPEHSIYYEVKF